MSWPPIFGFGQRIKYEKTAVQKAFFNLPPTFLIASKSPDGASHRGFYISRKNLLPAPNLKITYSLLLEFAPRGRIADIGRGPLSPLLFPGLQLDSLKIKF